MHLKQIDLCATSMSRYKDIAMEKPSLLVIDDDKSYLNLLKEFLETKFDVVIASSIDEADTIVANQDIFDIALVDEFIGQAHGSTWIEKNKRENLGATSFVLYSGLASEESILNGLACGADDFLSKPISLMSLMNKLDRLIDYQDKIHSFESEIATKDNVINISMAQASKYGACMQLTSRLNRCFSFEKIRDEIFSFLYSMNLKGCIAFYPIEGQASFYSSVNGYCSPVETDVMTLLHNKPRLFRFGARIIFNHPLVSLLILNLEDDSVDTDIYIDAFASVIECIGARIEFLLYKDALLAVQENIANAVSRTKRMVEISKHHNQEVMNEVVQNVGMSFHVLDLNEEQENYLTDLVHNALKKHSQDDVNFFEISEFLDQALNSVEQLKELNMQTIADHEEEIENEDDVLF